MKKKTRRKGKGWFWVVAILILFLAYSTFAGISTKYGDTENQIVKSASDIRFGIDIRGGVDVTFSPDEEIETTPEQMAAAQEVMEQRLISLGVTDYEIYKDAARGRIILRFPWQADETEFNPETAIQELSTTAHLSFREGNERDETTGEPTGVTAENIILEGSDVEKAEALYGQTSASGSAQHYVKLTLKPSGQEKFTEATTRLAQEENGTISIWLDNYVISAPTVNSAITDNTAIITGEFSAESAASLANTINSGALPFAMKAESYSTISPTLGSRSLQAMVIAGILAFILVMGFMIFNYRLPGFVASLSLMGQVAATIALISGYFVVFNSFTLTLPGIAGIILAIGMGVDANVITSERIKEELRGGKKLDASIKAGFQRGFAPILDGNVTVIIVAIILMGAFGPTDSLWAKVTWPFFNWFGVSTAGAIYSFGFTLFIGVLLNFVFGVFCTRVMLTSISKWKICRNPVLYGGLKEGQEEKVEKPLNIVGKRKAFFGGSIIAIVLILAFSLIFGVKMDVQFKGGAIVTYSYSTDFNMDDATGVVTEVLGGDVSVQEGQNTATKAKTLTVTLPGSETVEAETLDELTAVLNEAFPVSASAEEGTVNFEQLSVNNVDAGLGREFLLKCVVAVVAAMLLILVYIAIRFRKIGGWTGGFTAIVALVHDLIIIFGVFVIFRIPLNGNFIAALLTILGYSINDTVVIYDRIRENRGLYGRRMSFGKLVNLSINQSLRRSINTTLTTLIALGCVCIFSIVYGLDSIFTFVLPLMFGMVSGVYSTVCIAGPLWVAIENRRARKDKAAQKLAKEEAAQLAAEKEAEKAAKAEKNGKKVATAKDTKKLPAAKTKASKAVEETDETEDTDDEAAEVKTTQKKTAAKSGKDTKAAEKEEKSFADKERDTETKADKKTNEKKPVKAPAKADKEAEADEETAKAKKAPAAKAVAKKSAAKETAEQPEPAAVADKAKADAPEKAEDKKPAAVKKPATKAEKDTLAKESAKAADETDDTTGDAPATDSDEKE